MPTCRPARTATRNSSRLATKNRVTLRTSRTRFTREANAPYAGHQEQQQERLTGRRVALHLGAALAEDEHLARGLQHVVGGEQQEHQQRHQQHACGLVAPHVGDRREQPLNRALRPVGRGHATRTRKNVAVASVPWSPVRALRARLTGGVHGPPEQGRRPKKHSSDADATPAGRIAALGFPMISPRSCRIAVIVCFGLTLTACAPSAFAQGERPRLGVAFGGGSARGHRARRRHRAGSKSTTFPIDARRRHEHGRTHRRRLRRGHVGRRAARADRDHRLGRDVRKLVLSVQEHPAQGGRAQLPVTPRVRPAAAASCRRRRSTTASRSTCCWRGSPPATTTSSSSTSCRRRSGWSPSIC